MSPHMQELISQYGYWLMLVGALIEGEMFLIAGGIAAHHGLFNIPSLIILAIIGSLIHDHAFFYLGRFTKVEALIYRISKKPSSYKKFKRRVTKGLNLLDQYGVILIISFRFMYGLRTIIPIIIGLSKISKIKFFILDLIGATLWSCTFIFGGYYFGHAMENFFAFVHDRFHISWVFLIILSIIMVISITGIYLCIKKIILSMVKKQCPLD